MRLMRMHADRCARLRPQLLDAPRLRRFLLVAPFENHEGAFEPCITCTGDDGLEVLGESLVCEMAVRVDHDGFVCRETRRSNAANAASSADRNDAFVVGSAKEYSIELRASFLSVG